MFRTRAFDPISFAMTGFGILLVTGLPSFSEALPDLRWVGVQNTQHRLPQTLIIPDTATRWPLRGTIRGAFSRGLPPI
jgi:hypothetical protein